MPLTVPTHPAIAWLKVWRPRWFDGVALVVGSMAPDLAYALDGSGLPVWKMGHGLRAFVFWCLPVTLVAVWLIRRAAPVVASHLPRALHDYALLRHTSHPFRVTCWSALLGAVSHLLLDFLELQLPIAEPVMHVLGPLGSLALILYVARHRLLLRWHSAGQPVSSASTAVARKLPAHRPRPVHFWSIAAAVTLCAAALGLALPGAELIHATAVRLLLAVAAGVLVAARATAVPAMRSS